MIAHEPKLLLFLSLVLSGVLLGSSAVAQDTPEPTNRHSLLMFPSITNVNFLITHRISVRVPTKLKIERMTGMLSVSLDTNEFESTNLVVGSNAVAVVLGKLFAWPVGEPRPTNWIDGWQDAGLDFNLGTVVLSTNLDGLPQPGASYIVEMDLTAFETDARAGHMRMFPWSTNYNIIWKCVLKQIVE